MDLYSMIWIRIHGALIPGPAVVTETRLEGAGNAGGGDCLAGGGEGPGDGSSSENRILVPPPGQVEVQGAECRNDRGQGELLHNPGHVRPFQHFAWSTITRP